MADAITQFYNKLSTAASEQAAHSVSIWQANGKANPEYFLPNLKKKPDSGISHSEGSHSEHSDNEQKKQLNANNKRELTALEKLQLHGGKKQCIEQVADDSSEENINVDVVGSSEESDIDAPHHRLLNNLSNQESHEMSSSSSHSASGTLVLANGTQLLLPTSTARQRLFAQAEKQRRRQRRRESIRTKLDELMKQVRYLQREYSKTNENENINTSSTESDSCDEHAVGLLQSIALPTSSPLLEKLIKRELSGVVSKIVEQVKGQQEGNTTQHSCGEDSNGQSSSIETQSAPKTPSPTPPEQSITVDVTTLPSLPTTPTQLLPPANPIKQIPQIQKISPLPAMAAAAAAQRHTSLQTTPSRNLSKEMGTSSTAAFRPLLTNHQRTTSLTVAPTSNAVAPPSQTSPNNAYAAYLHAAQKIQQQQASVQQSNAQQLAALQQQSQQQAALAQAQQNAVAQQHAAAQQQQQPSNNVAAAAYQQAYQKALLAAKINQTNQEAMINQTLARQSAAPMLQSPLTKLPFGYDLGMGDGFHTFDPMDPHGFNAYHKEGLTPHHLKKAKLMFFYTRYPSSSILKTYFTDVRFNRATTSQLIKWFSNFREFFYIHIEKMARQAVQDGLEKPEGLTLSRDAELIRVLNNHYNKSNQFEVPNEFIRVAEQAMREFFQAIRDGKDQDPSWKKVIYKIICKLDAEIPAKFKAPQLAELGD